MPVKIAVLKETRANERRVALVPAVADKLVKLGAELTRVRQQVIQLLSGYQGKETAEAGTGGRGGEAGTPSTSLVLDQFGRNLTAAAMEGKLDPVIGREKEIERVMQVLSRRTKNNPVLIGEPGVGKTACVEGLAQANGRLELARSTAFAAGPALAGALIAWTGASAAFVLSGMLSVAAVFLLRGILEPARAPVPPRHPLLELKDGAQWVWRSDLLRPIVFTSIAWNIAWFMLQAAYVPYAIRVLGLDASGVGVTLACYGVGMILGSLLAPRVVAALPFGQAILVGPYFSVLVATTMACSLYWPQAWVAALSYFFFGVGPIIWTITSTTLRQTVTPRAMIGRVTSINIVVSTGARPLGAALGGFVGVNWPVSVSLWMVVAGFGVQAIIITASKVRTLKHLPDPLPD